MVPCAYLRAFEPLDTLPASDRERWVGYVSSGAGVTPGQALAVEARTSVARAVTGRPRRAGEVALVRRVGSRVHVCPVDLELRTAVAAVAFRETVPVQVADAFVDPVEDRSARAVIARASRPPHIREATWSVPLQWFTLFDPSERHHLDPLEGRGPRLTYLTTNGTAQERLERVVVAVDERIEDADPLLAVLADLMDWAEQFSPDSILELDYGGITGLVSPAVLAADLSCRDVWGSVEALERGDALAAAAHFAALRARWSSLRDRARTN